MAVIRKVKKIGEILIEAGLITKAQLEEALNLSKKRGARLGATLVNLGIVSEEDIGHALAQQFNIPYISLKDLIIEPHVIKLIPEALARRYMVIPFAKEGNNLKVAMFDPLDVFATDDLKKVSGCQILPSAATEAEIQRAIGQYYGIAGSIEEVAKGIAGAEIELLKGEEEMPEKLEKIAGEASVIQLVNLMISQAVGERSSDIHIEPDEDTLRIRMRVDGILHEMSNLSLKLHPAVISRVKILGGLDIAEKRLPQDGRFNIKIGNSDIDIRVSTLPAMFGEKVVMRLLNKSAILLKLEELTPLHDTLDALKKMINKPYGMILLTGPTGSGKTTTAYSILNMINSMDKNIVTVEDPIEYHLKVINQVQVNTKIGITFATALRHILRQDPDIVMIGEIRDKEAAEIAIHAALTGHLVISTIHTNNAVGTISRLLDMGIEPYLIASSIICLAGQRLIRGICPKCKGKYEPSPLLLQELGIPASEKISTLYKGQGCAVCKGSGLKGRLGIFEVLVINDEVRKLIVEKKDTNTILYAAIKNGFKTLRHEGIRAVARGYTTIEEVLQATQEIE
ncbi:MAG: Flp pilus assembly complex ATPase component TadA [Deltaproteobacteria bacterium]|nr:Flp pilus assembly complex ATPase component TadA [Deltaproteobacteria bacterium]